MFAWNMKPKTQTVSTLGLKPQIIKNSWTQASNSKEITNSRTQDSSLEFQEPKTQALWTQVQDIGFFPDAINRNLRTQETYESKGGCHFISSLFFHTAAFIPSLGSQMVGKELLCQQQFYINIAQYLALDHTSSLTSATLHSLCLSVIPRVLLLRLC